jgi:hypothetical protein
VACPVLAQKLLRGRLCGNFLFGLRPYDDSRARLTEGREVHSHGRGNVLSHRVPAAPVMVAQGPGLLHSGGDVQTGPEVTGEARSTGLTSRHRPAWVWSRCSSSFRWFCRPISRVRHAGRTGRVAQCHGVDTGLTAQRRTVAEMDAQGRGLGGQR